MSTSMRMADEEDKRSTIKAKRLGQDGEALERLGRLREKYLTIAQFYEVEVQHDLGRVKNITWKIKNQNEMNLRFAGSYYLRSDRSELDEKELWSLYTM